MFLQLFKFLEYAHIAALCALVGCWHIERLLGTAVGKGIKLCIYCLCVVGMVVLYEHHESLKFKINFETNQCKA